MLAILYSVNLTQTRTVNKKPENAILFLYEGDTELGFYDTLFDMLNLNGVAQIKKKCLKTGYNLNKLVWERIYDYLENKSNKHVKYLTVFVAYDRETKRDDPDYENRLNKQLIIKETGSKRLKGIHEIVATQMLESWFFIDIEGIYKYLKTPASKQKIHRYKAYENFRHEDLNALFMEVDKRNHYQKGDTAKKFIKELDLLKIYRQCEDLKQGIDSIFMTAGLKIPPTTSSKK